MERNYCITDAACIHTTWPEKVDEVFARETTLSGPLDPRGQLCDPQVTITIRHNPEIPRALVPQKLRELANDLLEWAK